MANSREEFEQPQRVQSATVLAAETLRNSCQPPPATGEQAKEEKGVPLVWRIFGGTVLSIAALVAVTLYQQLHNKVEAIGDHCLKKEEFLESRKGIWDHMEKIRAQEDCTDTDLKQRCTRLEQQARSSEDMHKETAAEMKQVRDMLFTLLKESSSQVEQRAKVWEEERKKLLTEIQQLRDRLASLEARKTADAGVRPATYRKKP
jgi:DNA repair exonuclease SbcCD ATPase subunit